MRTRSILGTALLPWLALICVVASPGGSGWANASSSVFVGAASLDAGSGHTCVVTTTGAVTCWGWNLFGQLGDGSAIDSPTPIHVAGLSSGVAAVSAGAYHTCALTNAGAVRCWGDGRFGQLGDGQTVGRATPVDVAGLQAGVTAITAGGVHTCALMLDSTVRCWGWNLSGQVGIDRHSEECYVESVTYCRRLPTELLAANGEPVDNVVAIAAGDIHTCALIADGSLLCWGDDRYGQLGDGIPGQGGLSFRHTPEPVVGLTDEAVDLSLGGDHSCLLTGQGGVECWGSNNLNQLGDGSYNSSAMPQEVTGLDLGVLSVDAGRNHTCVVVKGGSVKCWGSNFGGQIGNGESGYQVTSPLPTDVLQLKSTAVVTTGGDNHTCSLIATSGVRCWGLNSRGELGHATTELRNALPSDVLSDEDRDGCLDAAELGPDPALGGRRNPKDRWDFFDVPTGAPPARDRVVAVGDIGGVVQRFGTNGDPAGDPLLPPPPPPAYHTAYDRGGVIPGGDPWDLLPPNGSITVSDIAAVVAQFGHRCA